MPIRAITFDFWRTLFRDARSAERKQARIEALVRETGISETQAVEAMKPVMNEYMRVHIHEQRTLLPSDAVPLLEARLGVRFTPEAVARLSAAFGTAILDHPPEPIDAAIDAVRAAASRFPVGLISDTGISPGSSLEVLLERHGFLPHFKTLVYSDVMGVAKPRAEMFHAAAEGLGVRPDELLHIGDLEPTDIRGAIAVGGTAALFAGDNTRFIGTTTAHHTFVHWNEFIERLADIA